MAGAEPGGEYMAGLFEGLQRPVRLGPGNTRRSERSHGPVLRSL